MAQEFYRDGNSYVFLTGESPAGFKGMLFVVWAGEIDALAEAAYSKEQVESLKEVDVEFVPDKWLDAFEDASGIEIKRPEPAPAAPSRPSVFDDAAETEEERYEEFALHCAAGTDVETAMMVSGFGLIDDEPAPPSPGLRKLGPLFPRSDKQREPLTVWQVLATFALVIIFVLCMMAAQ